MQLLSAIRINALGKVITGRPIPQNPRVHSDSNFDYARNPIRLSIPLHISLYLRLFVTLIHSLLSFWCELTPVFIPPQINDTAATVLICMLISCQVFQNELIVVVFLKSCIWHTHLAYQLNLCQCFRNRDWLKTERKITAGGNNYVINMCQGCHAWTEGVSLF